MGDGIYALLGCIIGWILSEFVIYPLLKKYIHDLVN